jgi:hypothetical protein
MTNDERQMTKEFQSPNDEGEGLGSYYRVGAFSPKQSSKDVSGLWLFELLSSFGIRHSIVTRRSNTKSHP